MKTYAQRQHLRYTAAQLFELVADVERYSDFMPWVVESRIRHRREQTILVTMTIAAGPLRKQFLPVGTFQPPHRIDIKSDDSLFCRFEQPWTFEPLADGGTNVDHHLDFEFCSRALQLMMNRAFTERAAATLSASGDRARKLNCDQPPASDSF